MNIQGAGWYVGGLIVVAGAVILSVLWPLLALVIVAAVGVGLYVRTNSARFVGLGLTIGIAAAAGTGIRFISDSPTVLNYSDLRYATSAIAIVLSLGLLTKILPLLAREFWWLAMFFFALISLAWVPNVTSSFMTYSGWVCVVLIGALLAATHSLEKASKLVLNVMLWTSVVSLVLILVAPSIGRAAARRPDGVIEQMAVGVFAWNSELGFASGVGTVLAVSFWLTKRSSIRYLVQAALMGGVTVISDSATGLLAMGAGLVATIWACMPRFRAIICFLLVAAGLLWISGGIDAIQTYVLGLLGRSPTLSGRSAIWQIALDLAADQPAFGYGIGGSPDLALYLGFSAHAHNGYIQLLLELGYVGAAIIGLGLLVTTVRAVKLHSPLLGVLTVVLVSNLANNYLVTSNVAVALLAWVAFEVAKPMTNNDAVIVRSKMLEAKGADPVGLRRPLWHLAQYGPGRSEGLTNHTGP
ncbi:O-antigen ligase family protein [Pseudarthrobacter sp. S6]|uniref:O-antigen ligase family protein n=1 Tax=Pseudarthrobacter sp. S6 TaxID=3418420 RepID=UPI003CF0071A